MSAPVAVPFDYESLTVDQNGRVNGRFPHTAQRYREPLSGAIALEFVEVPAGRFQMGSGRGQGREEEWPQHYVAVGRFFMARALVTQAQWLAVMKRRPPCRFSGPDLPVENVAWSEARAFCERLSRQTGRAHGLPSEAQWEYACRAGGSSAFNCGETITAGLANYCGEHTYRAEAAGPYRHTTTAAGAFPPNAFGLFDMHGNLWEWCADAWHPNYDGAPAGDGAWEARGDPAGRVVRGGSWHDVPEACRSAARTRYEAGQGDDFVGFRVVAQPA